MEDWTPPERRFFEYLLSKLQWGHGKATPYWGYKGKVIHKAPYVGLPTNVHNYLLLDLDEEGAGCRWLEESLPHPTFVVVTPGNLHALYGYELATPVIKPNGNSSVKAYEFFQAILAAYRHRLCADTGYNEFNCKNPLSDRWKKYTFWNDRKYTFDELQKHVELVSKGKRNRAKAEQPKPTSPDSLLFHVGQQWAYKNFKVSPDRDHLQNAIWEYLNGYNQDAIAVEFGKREPAANVLGKAKSIAKWVWKRRNESWLADYGKERGALGFSPICSQWTDEERAEETRARQSEGAYYAHGKRNQATRDKIKESVNQIFERGGTISISSVAREANLSRLTVRRNKELLG
ncbi:protein of unknown function [Pseudodesulfovibrio piezophilus C1TLV30]|uniref:Primase C-terminal 1 domain-containing protein n=1 Tax=Pseudodesulfovibrio piezophilus (strain DSM 21447 / JCM 15486 / C1TLV30) TaxID=1322246 RepID=M1WRZ5_PSEP2|nr:protein of unknown function [Pseudodesulfovibrio piezophilus C1TLV30]